MQNSPIVGTPVGNDMSPTRRFGAFELDLREGELRRNGMKVKLQDQPFQVLAELVERPGQVVTREDLRNRLWPADTYVDFDHSLNAAIRRLRDALGDSAENPTFVETVARRGYRFLAPVSASPANGNDTSQLAPATETSPTADASSSRARRWWIVGGLSALALILLGLALGFFLAPHAPAPVRITRLTANPVDDPVHTAAISRDGRYLAYSDETGFYLRQIDTAETHPLALPDGMEITEITWFSDSAHIIVALQKGHDISLWELSAFGGNPRMLIEDGRSPAVSPDGKKIAYVAGKPLKQRIWVADITGEQPRELAGVDSDMFGSICWSPDGKKIAYTTAKFTYGYGAKGMIDILDVQNASVRRGRVAPSNVLSLFGLNAPLAWAPDGRLYYSQAEQRPRQADSNLWWIRLNSQGKADGAPVRLTNDQGAVYSVSASSDSKHVAYVRGVPQPDVYVAKLGPSGLLDEPQRLTLDDHQDLPFDWTPDGKYVIFVSDRTGTFDIYKQALDQTVPELLVSGTQHTVEPRLSPDGTQIQYLLNSNWGEDNYEVPLMTVPLAGGPARQVAKAKWISNHQCAHAPAKLCIYSVISQTGITFYTFDPLKGPGTQVYQVKDELAQLYNWTLSPDGTTLAIAKGKFDEEEPKIHLVSLNGGADRWFNIHGWPGVRALDWAADSKSLWAATSGEKDNTLLQIDLHGNARAVWRPKKVSVGWAIPSRDGKYLALHVNSSSANAWMLEK